MWLCSLWAFVPFWVDKDLWYTRRPVTALVAPFSTKGGRLASPSISYERSGHAENKNCNSGDNNVDTVVLLSGSTGPGECEQNRHASLVFRESDHQLRCGQPAGRSGF